VTKAVKRALIVLFKKTGAESIEIHSGDREPGTLIERADVLKVKDGKRKEKT
jgi:hypothetical protein